MDKVSRLRRKLKRQTARWSRARHKQVGAQYTWYDAVEDYEAKEKAMWDSNGLEKKLIRAYLKSGNSYIKTNHKRVVAEQKTTVAWDRQRGTHDKLSIVGSARSVG